MDGDDPQVGAAPRGIRRGALLVLPLFLAVWAVVARGTAGSVMRWGYHADPDGVYLVNSLSLATLRPIDHIDHPGTPVQILGAFALRAVHAVSGEGTLTEDVFRRPETYLSAIHLALLSALVAVLVAAGISVASETRTIRAGLCVQVAPLLSPTALGCLIRGSPEILLLAVDALLAACLVRGSGPGGDRRGGTPWLLGAICGLGMATKLTFAPILVVPLAAFPGWRRRAVFIAGGTLGFLVGTVPIWPRYPVLAGWVVSLVTHPRNYGRGEVGLPSLAFFLSNLSGFLRGEPAFLMLLGAALALVIASWVVPRFRRSGDPRLRVLLPTLVAGCVLQLLCAAKQPAHRYLMPALGLQGLLLVVLGEIAAPVVRERKALAAALLAVLAAGVAAGAGRSFAAVRGQLAERAERGTEWIGIEREIATRHAGAIVIRFRNILSWETADRFSGGRYRDLIRRIVGDAVFYDRETGRYYDWDGDRALAEIRHRGRPVLFRGPRDDLPDARLPDVRLRDVFFGRWETLFEIDGDESDAGRLRGATPPRPFPPADYRAAVALVDAAGEARRPGGVVRYRVRVTNSGGSVFPYRSFSDGRRGRVSLSWRISRSGSPDPGGPAGRSAPLVADVRPGESQVVPAFVELPPSPGDYEIRFDLAHEGFYWFSAKGNGVLTVPVRVE